MISKKGNKTDRTVMMENAILDYFSQYIGVKLNPEMPVSTGIVDFLGFVDGTDRVLDVIAIEIKQAVTDFYSGHGLNFVGSSNYLAVPSELVGFSIEFLRKNDLEYVGVLEVTPNALVRLIIEPRIYRHNNYIDVKFPASISTPVHLREKQAI